jgi:hypothetical protein
VAENAERPTPNAQWRIKAPTKGEAERFEIFQEIINGVMTNLENWCPQNATVSA